jgi:hypothetical protein
MLESQTRNSEPNVLLPRSNLLHTSKMTVSASLGQDSVILTWCKMFGPKSKMLDSLLTPSNTVTTSSDAIGLHQRLSKLSERVLINDASIQTLQPHLKWEGSCCSMQKYIRARGFVPKNDDSCHWLHVKGFKPNHARKKRNSCEEPFELIEAESDTECAQFEGPPEVRFRWK